MKMRNICINKSFIVLSVLLSFSCLALGKTEMKEISTTSIIQPVSLYILVGLVLLLVVIYALSKTILSLATLVSTSKKSFLLFLSLLFASSLLNAQTVTEVVRPTSTFPEWAMDSSLFLMSFLFFILGVSVFVLFKVNMNLVKALSKKEEIEEVKVEMIASQVSEPGFFQSFYIKMVDSVPVEKEADVMLDHDYDGIKELDNNLPPWWKYGFYFTIIFGVFYIFNYHVFKTGKLQVDEYKQELLIADNERIERLKSNAENINEDNVIALADPESIIEGKESFVKLCAACHRPDGGGLVGPNLTDEFWINGGGIKNIFKTVTYGVPSKGMISWKGQLTPKQIQQLASYILTLKGSNPVGPKEPQGDIWDETVKSLTVDSVTSVKIDSTITAINNIVK